MIGQVVGAERRMPAARGIRYVLCRKYVDCGNCVDSGSAAVSADPLTETMRLGITADPTYIHYNQTRTVTHWGAMPIFAWSEAAVALIRKNDDRMTMVMMTKQTDSEERLPTYCR